MVRRDRWGLTPGQRLCLEEDNRRARQKRLDEEAYACVQKIMEAGCPKKSVAVKETAAELTRAERSVWTSLKRHEQELISQARANRQWMIENGFEEQTAEEEKEMVDAYYQLLIDLRRGK
jgi:hypothetical protein